MRIVISNDVKEKITEIFDYSYNISYRYAHRIIKKIYEYIYSLENYPYIGRYVPELSYKYYREKICENYRIIYYASNIENKIYIQYIFSGMQNPNLFFKVYEKSLLKFLNRFLIN